LLLILTIFFNLFSKTILTFLFSQNDITFVQIESFLNKLKWHPILTRILSKIYYHTRLYAQKYILQAKSFSLPPPDWSCVQLPEDTIIRTKKIIFLRHSTSNFNQNKQQDKKRTQFQRVVSKFQRVLQEIVILPTNSTILLDPPLCKRGIYQSFKMQQFLTTFTSPQYQSQHGPKLQPQIDILEKCAGLDFCKLIKRLPVSLQRYQNQIQNKTQFDVIDILNGNQPGTAFQNHIAKNNPSSFTNNNSNNNNNNNNNNNSNDRGSANGTFHTFPDETLSVTPKSNPDLQHHATPPNTLLVSSSHRRAMTTLAIVCKGFLNQHRSKKINIHSSLASFSPSSPHVIPHLEGFDTNYISEIVKREEVYRGEELFSAKWNYGSAPISEPGIASIISFANWLSSRLEDNIVVCGHSTWLLWFFRTFLSRKITHVGKVQKLKNTCCISFDLNYADIPASLYNDVVEHNKKKWESKQDSDNGTDNNNSDVGEKETGFTNVTQHNDQQNSSNLSTQPTQPTQSTQSLSKKTDDKVKATRTVQWVNPDSIEIIYRGFDMNKFYQYQAQITNPKTKTNNPPNDAIVPEQTNETDNCNTNNDCVFQHHETPTDFDTAQAEDFVCHFPFVRDDENSFANHSQRNSNNNDNNTANVPNHPHQTHNNDISHNKRDSKDYYHRHDHHDEDDESRTISHFTLSHISSACSLDASFSSIDHHEKELHHLGFPALISRQEVNDEGDNHKDSVRIIRQNSNPINNEIINQPILEDEPLSHQDKIGLFYIEKNSSEVNSQASNDDHIDEKDGSYDNLSHYSPTTHSLHSNHEFLFESSYHHHQSIRTQSSLRSSSITTDESDPSNGGDSVGLKDQLDNPEEHYDDKAPLVCDLDDIDLQFSTLPATPTKTPLRSNNGAIKVALNDNNELSKSESNLFQQNTDIGVSPPLLKKFTSCRADSQIKAQNCNHLDGQFEDKTDTTVNNHQQNQNMIETRHDDRNNGKDYHHSHDNINNSSIASDNGNYHHSKTPPSANKAKHARNKSFSWHTSSREPFGGNK